VLRIERHSKSGSEVSEYQFGGRPRATAEPTAQWDEFGRKSNRGTVRRTASWDKTKLVLIEHIFPGYRFQRALHVNRNGQLVLEVRTPNVAADAESGAASDAILEPKRIVFRRK